jgi:ATP-dependent Lon protease
MHELTTLLMKSMRKQVQTGRIGLNMPPLLLVGEPGNGKSWYAEMIGRIAGVPVREIDVGGGSASFRISGLEKGWSGANPGIPVEMMLDHRSANPVIVVNEICKAGERVSSSSGAVSSLTTALLQVLERETAARFECPSFRIRFDLSRINFVLTANDLELVPGPLRDRCQVFRMPEVTPAVAGLMFDTLAGPMLTDVDPDVVGIAKSQVLRAAARGHVSLRQIRRVLDAIAADYPEPLH